MCYIYMLKRLNAEQYVHTCMHAHTLVDLWSHNRGAVGAHCTLVDPPISAK
jgi:hypothetical protein